MTLYLSWCQLFSRELYYATVVGVKSLDTRGYVPQRLKKARLVTVLPSLERTSVVLGMRHFC
jgi:hypothetical protein